MATMNSGRTNGQQRSISRRPVNLPANIDQESVNSIDALIFSQVNELSQADGSIFGRAMVMARAVNDLREAITPEMMKSVMALQGTKLGFRTDKDREGGYPEDVVKECLIESLLYGAMPTGNEMNIIASNAYLTLEFFRRKLREWPGLTDLEISLGIPVMSDKGAAVECFATWKIDEHDMRVEFLKTEKHDNRIAVKVNAGMGFDAVLGKAERKLRARIYQKITGSVRTLDGDADDVPPVTPKETIDARRNAASGSLQGLGVALLKCKTQSDVENLKSEWSQRPLTDQEFELLMDECEKRIKSL